MIEFQKQGEIWIQIVRMNQCYALPENITNHKKYEELRNRIETLFEEHANTSILTVIVPKKLARCIFVEKGRMNPLLHEVYF